MNMEPRFEKPNGSEKIHEIVLAFHSRSGNWVSASIANVRCFWGNPYTAWMPQPPEPKKPKRYEAREDHLGHYVLDGKYGWTNATRIPNLATAEAIAELYENPLGDK